MITCDYCPWPAKATIYLRRGPMRALLGRRPRKRYVCAAHLPARRRHDG